MLPLICAAMTLAPVTIHVSPTGDDANSGSASKPVATAARAIQIARATPGDVVVNFAPGLYRQTDSISIRRSSGSLLLTGTQATLSGAQVIEGFTVQPNGWWKAQVPADWKFEQLFVNGERRLRSRWPKNGYSHIARRVDPLPGNKGSDGFAFPAGAIDPSWINRDDIDIVTWLEWSIVRGKIAQIDGDVVRFRSSNGIEDSWAKFKESYRFFAENVREALGEPGEWYRSPEGELLYVPLPGETPETVTVEAPVADRIFDIGTAEGDPTVGVTLRGLSLVGTGWRTPSSGRFMYQAEADLAGAIHVVNAQGLKIEGCEIRLVGEYAIKIGAKCRAVDVLGNTMVDLGAGGVLVGEMQRYEDPTQATGNVRVEGNRIVGYGRIHPAGIGVWIGQNANNVVRGNWIEDGYYSGISVGWSWSYGPSGSRDNLIENNTISQIGHRVMSDMGGIYTLSPSPGTIIRGNRISDVTSYGYGGWGIYPDEGSTDILVTENVTFDTWNEGFHCHYGKNIRVENNVFAFGREAQVRRSRQEEHEALIFERNVVIFEVDQLFGAPYAGDMWTLNRFDRNLYWRVGGEAFRCGPLSWDEWRAKGQDKASKVADPLFRDARNGDFRLREGSPALDLGFKPFERLAPVARPAGLPTKVPPGFPEPKEFFPSRWD